MILYMTVLNYLIYDISDISNIRVNHSDISFNYDVFDVSFNFDVFDVSNNLDNLGNFAIFIIVCFIFVHILLFIFIIVFIIL